MTFSALRMSLRLICLFFAATAVSSLVGCGANAPANTTPLRMAVALPLFSVAPGPYASTQIVTITCATSGAAIYYTVNGSPPTTSSTLYTSPVAVMASETLQAIATLNGSSSSGTAVAAYVINLPATTPVFSIVGATYTSAQSVLITSATSGASIYYTTDGGVPTPASTQYTGPITVSISETLQAIATAPGSSSSAVTSAAYVINLPAATPVFSIAAGMYTPVQTVAITSATSVASIYYTTDGSVPTASSTLYTGPITVSTSETIQAIATAVGSSSSAVASAAYSIHQPTTLVFSRTSVNFPPTAAGFAAVPIAVSIYNGGSSPVTFTGFAVAGTHGSDFAQVSDCGIPLQPKQSCVAQLSATPGDLGDRKGVFMVSSDASGSPQTVDLTVTGLFRLRVQQA